MRPRFAYHHNDNALLICLPPCMIPKSLPLDLIRGWCPVFGQDHAQERGKRSAERRMPSTVRATPVSVTACRCAGRGSAPKVGARSPSGAPLRHSPRLLPLGSASGRASWNYRVQTGGPSPAPVQRAPRGPVVVPDGRCPKPPECGVTSPARGNRSRSAVGTSPVTPSMSEICCM